MLYIRTRVAPSLIHGVGLFSVDFVPAGALVWKFAARIDRLLTIGTVEQLPRHAREFIEHYASRISQDLFLICGDDARFVNHAEPGNIRCPDNSLDCDDIALRDIAPGEEITEDYTKFSVTWNTRKEGE